MDLGVEGQGLTLMSKLRLSHLLVRTVPFRVGSVSIYKHSHPCKQKDIVAHGL